MGKGERLKRLIEESSFKNISRFSKASEVPYTTIKSFIERDLNKASIDSVVKIAKTLDVSVEYLIGEDPLQESSVKESSSSYFYYPQSVSAGLPMHVDGVTDANEIDVPDSVMGKWAKDRDVFMMKINGESMNKTIPHGSLIAVKQFNLENLKEGDIVLYSHNNEYSVKRFYRSNGSVIFRPHSSDLRFTDNVIPSDDSNLIIHGKVVVYIVELD